MLLKYQGLTLYVKNLKTVNFYAVYVTGQFNVVFTNR